MIVICYGMQRSGSTRLFELVRVILEANGHAQIQLPGSSLGHDRNDNFIEHVTVETLTELQALASGSTLCFKTHAPAHGGVAQLLQEHPHEFPAVIVSYRDPRGIGLSLLDAGHRARVGLKSNPSRVVLAANRLTHRNPYGEAFANIIDHNDAIDVVAGSIDNAASWLGVPQASAFSYESLESDWEHQVERVGKALNMDVEMEAVDRGLAHRFTQQHVGVSGRFERELSAEMQQLYRERLSGRFEAVFGHSF